ncbi:hypothetical protein [Bosea sp. AAP35]|uniref:hypothetical protein n=1 Tax=Bosea sp. AAP35 TaxID=1523417 RepID=UPI0012E196AD|nr:hypothetical protein [Bosea sp. AAP35]
MPKLDLSKLTREVTRRKQDRPDGIGPGGRPVSGAMAMIRDNLAHLDALHAAGATWVDIAASLASQGVHHGSGAPLTGRQLTGLIASVRRQARQREARTAKRLARPDLPKVAAARLQLSPDLAVRRSMPTPLSLATEEDLRREALASLDSLLKKEDR